MSEPSPPRWRRERISKAGYFGDCDACHDPIEGQPEADFLITFIVDIRWDGGRRYYHEGCEPERAGAPPSPPPSKAHFSASPTEP